MQQAAIIFGRRFQRVTECVAEIEQRTGAFFFFIGVFVQGPDSMVSSTAAMDFGTKRGASTATGFVNGIGSLGGILGGYLPGAITTENDWSALFGVLLVGLTMSAIVLLPLWRTKPPTAGR